MPVRYPQRSHHAIPAILAALATLAASNAQAALLIVCGEAIGIADNNFSPEARNIVKYAFDNGKAATHEFAIFQIQDPNSATVVKDAITANAHTFNTFAPADLSGFPFKDYRVVVLNWDTTVGAAIADPTSAAIPALETYVKAGGVVWIQASLQFDLGFVNAFPLPFGGTQVTDGDFYLGNWIIDFASPMMAGLGPNPIGGGVVASTAHSIDLPAGAHIVKRATDENGVVTLYDLHPVIFADGFEP